jgi:diketogulonate reductase-like aldo/keto reductase
MIIPVKKLKSGFAMPEYGLGTWQMGGRYEVERNNDQSEIAAIKKALDIGITHIDTAEIYGLGHTEELVGEAIKDYDRSKLFVVSKVHGNNLSQEGIIRACEESLKRLRLDYLDLYLMHRYNPAFSLRESVKALDELKAGGLIKEIGVSNFGVEHLAEAQSYTKNKIACNQVHYNLEYREPEAGGLLDYCQKNDVMLIAWRPVSKGELLDNVPAVLQQLCDKYQKTPAQVAINWLVSQSNVVTLSKTSRREHLEENLGALGWYMEESDVELLRDQYPNQKKISDVVPLG